jgi:glucosamine--fructose-6-phosphate aminotransferase (isomerizing)
MCGVLGLICEKHREDLGRVAAELLKTLEYRGYDSTGAAIQGDDLEIQLVKGVGAPSVMVDQLGIVDLAGSIFCGQVRWATFGAVDDLNSQPHLMRCKTLLYGAHNGNVTNCDDLKAWLTSEGHDVLSDNDGEMVVHTVEHYFAKELSNEGGKEEPQDADIRRRCMRAALLDAGRKLQGSYAAVIVDPVSRTEWAIKQGSSLYFGIGQSEKSGRFGIASSDLSSVLKLTRVVVPMAEGEFCEFTPEYYQLYAIKDRVIRSGKKVQHVEAGDTLERTPKRSRLRAKDTALMPPFEYFMDQEIRAQEQTCRNVVTIFSGGTEACKVLSPLIDRLDKAELSSLRGDLDLLRDQYDDDTIRKQFYALVDTVTGQKLIDSVPADLVKSGVDVPPEQLAERLSSAEAGFFTDLMAMARNERDLLAVRLFDVLLEREEVAEYATAIDRFAGICMESLARGGRCFVICCGSSFHAAKAASIFFNEIAHTELIPILPGEFRGQYAHSLKDGDLFIAVSQSGETKDLIDVLNVVIDSGRQIGRVAVVNNVNSTLAQEKAHLVIPLRCGPEIAVPATKSFINQMVVLYCLALRLGQRRLDGLPIGPEEREELATQLEDRLDKLVRLPELIKETFDSTDADVEKAAQMLFLTPSIHILATRINAVAMEGALKIREVVLNHTEGFEGSEFKHGPNTILGFNTIFGPEEVDTMLKRMGVVLTDLVHRALTARMPQRSIERLVQLVTDSVFSPTQTLFSLNREELELFEKVQDRQRLIEALYSDYPLIFITGPDQQDVNLTVSQINTHKIRGAQTVVIAEDNPALRQAATKAPADNLTYQSVMVTLPRTDDTLITMFSSTVVLQRLALKMSELKMQYLDRLNIADHGVHPDVPKNVSKSITVD